MQEKYKTFWKRFWASIIDALIFAPVVFIDNWFFAQELSGWINLIYYVLFSCLLPYAYYIYMHGRYGQTVGKMITGVKLLTLGEEPLDYKRALLRESIPLLLVILFVFYDAPEILRGVNPHDIEAEFGVLLILSIFWSVAELITMLTNKKTPCFA